MKRHVFFIGLGAATIVITVLSLFILNPDNVSGGKQMAAVSTGTVAIGGPFTLVDHNGKTVTDTDFKGRIMLIFFGYTFCPDVCPTALSGVSEALDLLGDDAEKVAPLFISVDPERDTVEALKEYVSNFHPNITGLTGTPDQIAAAAKAYRAYYSKEADKKDDEFYLVSHTAYLYLMGPDGMFLTAFKHETKPEYMAEQIKRHLAP